MRTKARELWIGKPWILPNVLSRSILVVVIAAVISWLEFLFDDVAYNTRILGIPVILWTAFAFFLVWLVSLTHLLLLRASNTYLLRNDGLEVRTGILSSKSYVVAPAGFSDLEVTISISGRIVNSGNIIVRTQGDYDITMIKVRKPLKVAGQIREVMARPTVRVAGQEIVVEKGDQSNRSMKNTASF